MWGQGRSRRIDGASSGARGRGNKRGRMGCEFGCDAQMTAGPPRGMGAARACHCSSVSGGVCSKCCGMFARCGGNDEVKCGWWYGA